MKYALSLIGLLAILISCGPSDADFESAIEAYFMESTRTPGAGNTKVHALEIISVKPDSVHQGVLWVEAKVTATYSNQSLPTPEGPSSSERIHTFEIRKGENGDLQAFLRK